MTDGQTDKHDRILLSVYALRINKLYR